MSDDRSDRSYRAEYLLPGAFFPETAVKSLSKPDPLEAVRQAPESAYCFTIYEVSSPPDLGPEFRVTSVPRNRSGRFYIGGEVFSIIEVKAMGDDKRILAANMEANHWPFIIRCRTGNWQPFEDGDAIVNEPTASRSPAMHVEAGQ